MVLGGLIAHQGDQMYYRSAEYISTPGDLRGLRGETHTFILGMAGFSTLGSRRRVRHSSALLPPAVLAVL